MLQNLQPTPLTSEWTLPNFASQYNWMILFYCWRSVTKKMRLSQNRLGKDYNHNLFCLFGLVFYKFRVWKHSVMPLLRAASNDSARICHILWQSWIYLMELYLMSTMSLRRLYMRRLSNKKKEVYIHARRKEKNNTVQHKKKS